MIVAEHSFTISQIMIPRNSKKKGDTRIKFELSSLKSLIYDNSTLTIDTYDYLNAYIGEI